MNLIFFAVVIFSSSVWATQVRKFSCKGVDSGWTASVSIYSNGQLSKGSFLAVNGHETIRQNLDYQLRNDEGISYIGGQNFVFKVGFFRDYKFSNQAIDVDLECVEKMVEEKTFQCLVYACTRDGVANRVFEVVKDFQCSNFKPQCKT